MERYLKTKPVLPIMNIADLLGDSSSNTAKMVAGLVIEKPSLLDEIFTLAFSNQHKMAMRASNVIYKVFDRKPNMIIPYFNTLLEQLRLINDASAKRNILRIFTEYKKDLTEEQTGLLMDTSFRFLESNESELAHKVYSMHILYKISNEIPEIKAELADIIQIHIPHSQPAFKSMGSKILRKLQKELNRN